MHYLDNYYVAVAHGMFHRYNGYRHYSTHIVVLHVRPFRIVYISNNVVIDRDIYKDFPSIKGNKVNENFIFPIGIIMEDANTVMFSAHVNDHSSILLRLRGLKDLMDDVMASDTLEKPRRGPPVGYVQQHLFNVVSKETKLNLVHGPDKKTLRDYGLDIYDT